ncbi:MAG: zinc ribbon domain-containing protein [Clostridiales bacterium]|nr:zinc ribbon domain-containing protein [Clostridiales bacterium]
MPDSVIRSWGELPGNIYIRKEKDGLGKVSFKYKRESTWKRDHKKKTPGPAAPELTIENYPYKDHIFCAKCGSKLTRYVQPSNGRVTWVCNGKKHKGSEFCEGIRIPDDVIRGWGEIKKDIFIRAKENRYGQRSYGHSRKKDKTVEREQTAG